MSLLVVDNVHAYYGNIHALKGVSINIDQGEIV
ncbi:MAG: ABC transporter ATP-binding protein, partial [Chloroflexi bacterium]